MDLDQWADSSFFYIIFIILNKKKCLQYLFVLRLFLFLPSRWNIFIVWYRSGPRAGFPMSDYVSRLNPPRFMSYEALEVACHATESYCDRLVEEQVEKLKVGLWRFVVPFINWQIHQLGCEIGQHEWIVPILRNIWCSRLQFYTRSIATVLRWRLFYASEAFTGPVYAASATLTSWLLVSTLWKQSTGWPLIWRPKNSCRISLSRAFVNGRGLSLSTAYDLSWHHLSKLSFSSTDSSISASMVRALFRYCDSFKYVTISQSIWFVHKFLIHSSSNMLSWKLWCSSIAKM